MPKKFKPKSLAEIDKEIFEAKIEENKTNVNHEMVLIPQCMSLDELDAQFVAGVKRAKETKSELIMSEEPLLDEESYGEIIVFPKPTTLRRVWRSRMTSCILYIFLTFAVLFTLASRNGGENSPPLNLFGFSFMRVLTHSMQSELPQGSMIITRRVRDASTLELGNDITFLMDANNTVVTHRIIYIYENHNNSGAPAFRTQGIESDRPDHNLVHPENIIGRVIYNSMFLGNASVFLGQHIIPIIICIVLILMLMTTLKIAFTKVKSEEELEQEESFVFNDITHF